MIGRIATPDECRRIIACADDQSISTIEYADESYLKDTILAIDDIEPNKTLFIVVNDKSDLSEVMIEGYVLDNKTLTIKPFEGNNFHCFYQGVD